MGNEINSMGNEINSMGNEINSMGNEINSMGNEINSMGNEINSMGNEINSMGNEINSMGNEINSMGNEINSMGNEINSMGNEINGTGNEINGTGNEINGTGNEINIFHLLLDTLYSLVLKKMGLVSLFVFMLFVSCEPTNLPDSIAREKGLIVLCEGLWGKNNSVISYVNEVTKNVTLDVFEQKNGQSLGDTGNDILKYGGKWYVVVNGSAKVEVIEAGSFKRIKQIPFLTNGKNKNPRNLAAEKGKVFVSNWDGTVSVIDTVLLTVEKSISLTVSYPEKMLVMNGKLFVAAAGNYANNYEGGGVAVINLETMTQTNVISAGKNLGDIAMGINQRLLVVRRGLYDADYSFVEPRVVVINAENETVVETYSFDALEIETHGSILFAVTREKVAEVFKYHVLKFDMEGGKIINAKLVDSELHGISTLYRMTVSNANLYVTDAKDYQVQGDVFVFKQDGTKQYSFKAGINPSLVFETVLD
ncbi:hypothetical protein CHS0354_000783 [Potamilus streckersoni]|uniref:Uncharacterized protein n=1 Tax=Potamilus streckersoni TaxID=2493646 RepID=A0AAE0W9F0_9BIVA|nr:hypothetical protein CHS0354_000783 [Potamilus streckersoni]